MSQTTARSTAIKNIVLLSLLFYSASSTGHSIDMKDGKVGMPTPTLSMPVSGNADSTTKSAIAPGTITITGKQTQGLNNLSRDPSGALNTLGKIFDKKSVQEKQELAQVFSEEANKLVGDIADREKDRIANKILNAKNDIEREQLKKEYARWVEGGTNKDLFHTMVGGLTAQLAGGDFLSGATGAGFNEILQKELKKIKDPALHQWASLLVGTVADKIVNGNGTGAVTALNGTKYNFLSHWQTEERDDAIANEDWDKVAYWDLIDKAQDQIANGMGINSNSIDWDDSNNAGLLNTISIQAQELEADPDFKNSFITNLQTVDLSTLIEAGSIGTVVVMAGVIVYNLNGNWVKLPPIFNGGLKALNTINIYNFTIKSKHLDVINNGTVEMPIIMDDIGPYRYNALLKFENVVHVEVNRRKPWGPGINIISLDIDSIEGALLKVEIVLSSGDEINIMASIMIYSTED